MGTMRPGRGHSHEPRPAPRAARGRSRRPAAALLALPALALLAACSAPSGSAATHGSPTTTASPSTTAGHSASTVPPVPPTTPVPGAVAPSAPGAHRGPFLRGFRPASAAPGSVLTVTGKRLGHLVSVSIDGLRATVTAHSTTRVQVVVPGGATSGPISVATRYGVATLFGFVVS